jgi:hypothetical protein
MANRAERGLPIGCPVTRTSLGVKPQWGIDLRQDGVVPVGSDEIELSEHDLRERMLSVSGRSLLADTPPGGVIDGAAALIGTR